MCGITGFLSSIISDQDWTPLITDMTRQLKHRGPDDEGVWVDHKAGVALGHRRLSIVDLSKLGHQPMKSRSGRYIVVYNGEIYNFQRLRKELEQQGYFFQSDSDTEVLLSSIEYWGIKKALENLVGMFAFALWDKKEQVLTLARDCLGEKPLYFGWQGRSFMFASELKALKMHPDWEGEIDRSALVLLMRHNCISAPRSIYRGIQKLMPGTFIQVGMGQKIGEVADPVPYWSARRVVEDGAENPFLYNEQEAIEALDSLLSETIQDKMISDVPLGALLSGGIDSSTIVALMQALSTQKVKTFSIGFHEKGFDEAQHAKKVARFLGTDHTELYVSPEQAMGVIPNLPQLYDEPFSDSSQIPTFLVSQMTRQYVTVALSGDGGDELFGGYNRHVLGQSLLKKLAWMPELVRSVAANCLLSVPPHSWDKIGGFFEKVISTTFPQTGDKLHKLALVLSANSTKEMYKRFITHWNQASELVIGAEEPVTVLNNCEMWAELKEPAEQMMFMDMVSYLPDDILAKVDRAAMGVSLETRVPFLDHRVVEFAWKLPLNLKIRNGKGKWILRQVLDKYVPGDLVDRPKAGFAIPIDSWLRGPLRDWAENLLSEKRLSDEGFFNPLPIRNKWKEHLSGRRNWQYHLWDVLMFQAWNDHQKQMVS